MKDENKKAKLKIEEEPNLTRRDFEMSWNSRKYPMTILEIENNMRHLDMSQVLFCRAKEITVEFLNKFKNRTAQYISVEQGKIVFVMGNCCDIITKHTNLSAKELDDDILEYISKKETVAPFSNNTYKYA